MSGRDRLVCRLAFLVSSFTVPVAVLMGALSGVPVYDPPGAPVDVYVTMVHPH